MLNCSRSNRLADLFEADNALLKSKDPALRQSFYRRFNPASYQRWPDFAETEQEHFLNSALSAQSVRYFKVGF